MQLPKIDMPHYYADMLKPFRYLGWHGGRGAGKSRTVGTGLVLEMLKGHERILCGREVQKSIRDSVKRLLDDEIDRLGVRAAFVSTETEIRGPHDSLVLFSGVKGQANALKSIEGITTFWGEEAQAFSQSSIDTIEPTIRAPKSKLIFTWNPNLPTDPIDVLLRGDPPPRSIVREVNHYDNPYFPPDLREKMEFDQSRDIDKFNHIWLGKYRRNSEARVFKNWRVEAFDSPDNVTYRLGADFGFSVDPSCLVRCWIDGTKLYIDHEAYAHNVEIVNLPHLFMSIPDAEKYPITADSARPETISHLRNNGFPKIISALKGARSIEEGVEFLKGYDIIVHPRCRNLIEELTLYSYKVDPLTGQVIGELADKDNNMIDALRYAVEGARRALAGIKRIVSVVIPSTSNGFNRR